MGAQWSKFCAEVAQKVVDLVARGATRGNAAAQVGVTDRTVKLWVTKGRRNLDAVEAGGELDEYGLFVGELLRVEATITSKAGATLVELLQNGPPELRLRAATTWLKYRGGPEWRIRVEQVGRDGEPVHDGARDRLAARIAEKRAALGGGDKPVTH